MSNFLRTRERVLAVATVAGVGVAALAGCGGGGNKGVDKLPTPSETTTSQNANPATTGPAETSPSASEPTAAVTSEDPGTQVEQPATSAVETSPTQGSYFDNLDAQGKATWQQMMDYFQSQGYTVVASEGGNVTTITCETDPSNPNSPTTLTFTSPDQVQIAGRAGSEMNSVNQLIEVTFPNLEQPGNLKPCN